jgi:hypothetical protein
VSCSSAETTVGANVKGSENRKVSPNTRETKEDVQFTNSRKTGNLPGSLLWWHHELFFG